MKVGVISDIHSNIIALKAVIDFLTKQGCKSFICCGDIIGIGPYPEQTVTCIRQLPNLTVVAGNHEVYLKKYLNGEQAIDKDISHEEQMQKEWEYQRLSSSSIEFLCNLPIRSDILIKGKRVSIMHYALNENNDFIEITKNPSKEDLSMMFQKVKSDVIIFGHNHKQTIQKVDDSLFVDFGSVGCPSNLKNVACAGILTFTDEDVVATSVNVPYDVNKVFVDMEKYNFPAYELIKQYFFGIRNEK